MWNKIDKLHEWKKSLKQTNSRPQPVEAVQADLIKKIPFIFDWHQGRVLPTPAYGITPKTQKSEHQTDDVNLRETGNVSEEKNCDNKREGDNGDNYPR